MKEQQLADSENNNLQDLNSSTDTIETIDSGIETSTETTISSEIIVDQETPSAQIEEEIENSDIIKKEEPIANDTVISEVQTELPVISDTEAIVEIIEEKKIKLKKVKNKIENISISEDVSTSESIEISEVQSGKEKITTNEIPISEEEKTLSLPDNFETFDKHQLIEMLESIVNKDINAIKTAVTSIKGAFHKIIREEKLAAFDKYISDGGVKEDFVPSIDESEERFNKSFSIYREKKQIQVQQLEKQKLTNLVEKQGIIESLKTLIDSDEELKKTYDAFKALQDRWKEIGQVPQADVNNLWQNYHFLIEKFFDKVKINKELKDLDLRKNLEIKVKICEKAEELIVETSITKSFNLLQQYHEEWREVGPIPTDKKDEIWDRFRSATEKINQRRQEYYKELQVEQENNYQAKLALCEKAESLNEVVCNNAKEWQDVTDQFNELMKFWKTIGAAPKKVNDEVWTKFKTSIDGFFSNKKLFLNKNYEEQLNNYNLKVNLCIQAEAIQDSQDWKHTTEKLIEIQKEWKNIGPTPKKHSDKIWKRFRATCDHFFNSKSNYFSNIDSIETDNLKKKQDLIKIVEEHNFGADNNESLTVLKDFQRQWMEIGHVPIKEKDNLHNQFRAAINKHFDSLKLNSTEKNSMNYKSKLENIKNSPNSDNALYKEKTFIVNKISALKNDIKLWENNIGFFAKSKNADILKQEFESKIKNAADEVKALEDKIKLIQNS